jgi:hypothetical protein
LNGFDIHTCRIYVQIRLSHFSWNARQWHRGMGRKQILWHLSCSQLSRMNRAS